MTYIIMQWYRSRMIFFCVKQKTAYEMRISDWSSDVCSSDLGPSESAQYTAEIRNRADALFPPAPSYVIVGGPLRRKPVAPAKPRPLTTTSRAEIGRASCRERVCPYV